MWARHVFQVPFDPVYICFRLDFVPNYVFIGVYIQPEGARYFKMEMFSRLGATLIEYYEKGLTHVIGEDLTRDPETYVY